MKIAVLSGKGGTGKTLLSVNLAAVAENSTYVDCDVEEPNGHLFFNPENLLEKEVTVKIPQIDENLCNGCRKCVDFCKFNAFAYVKDKVVVFEEICHSCGGCTFLCPEKAINEKDKAIGKIQKGISDQVYVYTGILNIGQPSGIPIINNLLSDEIFEENKLIIIDSPPGTSCLVMESIIDADYCIVVAEPTLFGVHNLNMVYELVRLFNIPFGVVINKYLEVDNPVEDFCRKKNIKILERIPMDTTLGKLNSNGVIVSKENDKYREFFSSLLTTVIKEVDHETTTYP